MDGFSLPHAKMPGSTHCPSCGQSWSDIERRGLVCELPKGGTSQWNPGSASEDVWGLFLFMSNPLARGYLPDERTNGRATRALARQSSLMHRGAGRRTRMPHRVRNHHLAGPRVVRLVAVCDHGGRAA